MYSENESELQEDKNNSFIGNFYHNNKVLVWVLLIVILFIAIMSFMSNNNSVNVKKYDVEIVNLTDSSIEITKGSIYTMKGKVSDDPKAVLKWSSADESIAKVDNGAVTGVNYGKTMITATYIDNNGGKHTVSKEVIVSTGDPSVNLQSVSFKDGDLFMPVGATYQIALTLNPPKGHVESKEFNSSDPNVITVDDEGLVTAINEGSAIISVSVNGGLFRKELNAYVNKDYRRTEIIVTPDIIRFDNDLRKIKVGAKEKMAITVSPLDVDQGKFDWTSSDINVVTVDGDGFITGINEGRATITVTAMNGLSDKIDVEVESDIVDVKDINVSISDLTLTVGQSQDITPIVIPNNASNKGLSYISMDSNIVSIFGNSTGTSATITAISAGTTSIIIRSNNNIEKTINVTVIDPNPVQPSPTSSTDLQGFKISSRDANGKGYVNATYERTKPANNGATGPVTITIEITDPLTAYARVAVCDYQAIECNPESLSTIEQINDSGDFTIENIGEYIIRIWRYDSNNVRIGETDKFIWIKDKINNTPPSSCESGKYLLGSQCVNCPAGSYCTGGVKYSCPAGKGSIPNSKSYQECDVCSNNTYSIGDGTGCHACPPGQTANASHTNCSEQPTSTSRTSLNVSDISIAFPNDTMLPVVNGTTYRTMNLKVNTGIKSDIYFCVDQPSSKSKTPVSRMRGTYNGKIYYYQKSSTCNKFSNVTFSDIYVPNGSKICISLERSGVKSTDKCVTAQ